jgi:hypothetical protein
VPSAAKPLGWKASIGPCNVCSQMGHLGRTCPARECRECGGSGHIAKHCPARLSGSRRVEGSAESAGATAAGDVRSQVSSLPAPTSNGASLTCSHCGGIGHAAGRCTFGWRAGEEYLLCGSAACFTRHFILPLRQAKTDFNEAEPHEGRMDVATSCISAAVSRSQSLRGNAIMTLCFKEQRVNMQARARRPPEFPSTTRPALSIHRLIGHCGPHLALFNPPHPPCRRNPRCHLFPEPAWHCQPGSQPLVGQGFTPSNEV